MSITTGRSDVSFNQFGAERNRVSTYNLGALDYEAGFVEASQTVKTFIALRSSTETRFAGLKVGSSRKMATK